MTLNGVMSVTLRYFTEFGKHTFQHVTAASIYGRIRICTSLLYSVLGVRCRRKESSRSLSHLLMSFLLDVSLTMGLTRCYKTEGFLHLLFL